MRYICRMKRYGLILFLCLSLFVSGCEDTNILVATDAGIDALKAVTLSDENVRALAEKSSRQADQNHRIAPVTGPYGKRLYALTGENHSAYGYRFDFKVYLSPTVNAFAMADGTIRIYSGLMDMLDDKELLFVIGHEMGHVVEKHISKKIRVAYAGRAIRKGIASQENIAGDIARSALGGLVEQLANAQFSQQEERQADDFGVSYLQKRGVGKKHAVSALHKLAGLGVDHSFLSSHPAPRARAERLQERIASPDQKEPFLPSFFSKILNWLKSIFSNLIRPILE